MKFLLLSYKGYPTCWLRQVMSVTAAFLIVIFGEELSWMEILLHPSFKLAMLGSYLIALILIEYTHFITIFLDRIFRLSLADNYLYVMRITAQILVVLLPTLSFAAYLAQLYFSYGYDIDIADTSYPTYEIQYITALLVILNGFYLFCCYLKYESEPKYAYVVDTTYRTEVKLLSENKQEVKEKKRGITKKRLLLIRFKQPLEIWTPDTLLMGVPLGKIAYFTLEPAGYLFYTYEGECIGFDRSLDRTMGHLPGDQYKRVTKNLIISRASYVDKEDVPYYRWEIILNPPFKGNTKLSRKKTRELRKWLED